MAIRTVDQIDSKGKRVFIRVDFNVPLNEKKEVTDDTRIVLSLPTIRYVIEAGGGRSWLPTWAGPREREIPNTAWPRWP